MTFNPATFDPGNDADWATLDMQAAAANARNGVCGICDEALNPFAPKWAGSWSERNTPEMVAAAYGPAHTDLPYHVSCLEAD